MERFNPKRQQKFKLLSKVPIAVGVGFLVWIALLISPLGSIVAAVTIFGLVGVLFVLGCINVQGDDSKK